MSVCNSSFSTHTANVPYQPCSYVLCPFTQMPVCSYGEKEQLLDSVSLSPQSTLSSLILALACVTIRKPCKCCQGLQHSSCNNDLQTTT